MEWMRSRGAEQIWISCLIVRTECVFKKFGISHYHHDIYRRKVLTFGGKSLGNYACLASELIQMIVLMEVETWTGLNVKFIKHYKNCCLCRSCKFGYANVTTKRHCVDIFKAEVSIILVKTKTTPTFKTIDNINSTYEYWFH